MHLSFEDCRKTDESFLRGFLVDDMAALPMDAQTLYLFLFQR